MTTSSPPLEAPLSLPQVLPHLQANGLVGAFDVGTLARAAGRAFRRPIERLTESEILEVLWRYYGGGQAVGVGANDYAARDAVIFFKESHDLEGEEEIEARRDIAAVLARLGVTVAEKELEDLGDYQSIGRAIDAALAAIGSRSRAHLHTSRATGIAVLLIREQLAAGLLRFCSPDPGSRIP